MTIDQVSQNREFFNLYFTDPERFYSILFMQRYESKEGFEVPRIPDRPKRLNRKNKHFREGILGTIDDAILNDTETIIKIQKGSDGSTYLAMTYQRKPRTHPTS